ncbi:hypothetical protein [Kitasatospora phosalacinea]|uniref:Secreted protein n=1 Tax=Kitasatospora phosalacinea TaxID=2065 RepID=A0A9W6PGV7_9ACTN|nr:hypothetical protein [Kitasatospora phosalacinea]GLW54637.1 hypothetical protein Kpho01_26480 [Kitasatospora phosalacinea]
MKHRTTATTLLLAAALLAAAAPADAQSVPPPGTQVQVQASDARARAWRADAFPAGEATVRSAARVGGRTTWALGARVVGKGGKRPLVEVAYARDGADGPWRELALPEGVSGTTVTPDGSGGTWVTGSGQGGTVSVSRYRAGQWQTQEAPLPAHPMGGGLNGFATAGDPDDVWAVGYYQPDDFLTFYGVIDHWDGKAWQQVPTPDLGTDYWTLSAVVANSPSDVWASGDVGNEDGWARPLLLHYDGHAWSKVATPALDTRPGELTDLVVAGPNDIWAAGAEIGPSHRAKPTVAHYDGRSWTYQEIGIDAGRLYGLVRTPNGVAVVGASLTDGVYRPTGAQLTGRGWEPLDIPQSTTPGGRRPADIVSVAGRLTVVGTDYAGTADERVELPFSLTR